MNQIALDLFDSGSGADKSLVALGPNARQSLADLGDSPNDSPGDSPGDGPGSAADEVVLGELVWYSVSDAVRLTPDKLIAAIEAAKLDPKRLLPRAPTAPSALSRAAEAAEVKGRRLTTDRSGAPVSDELYANVLFRSAARGVKQVVVEIVDAANARLFYQPVTTLSPSLTSGRPDGTIHVDRIKDEDAPVGDILDAAVDAISNLKSYYDFEKDRHDGEAARRVLGRVLWDAKAVPLRNSGGMYFVPRGHTGEAAKILSFVEEVRVKAESAPARTPRASMAMKVPLVDREEYRAVLADSVEFFVQKEARSLIQEMSSLLKAKKNVSARRGRGFVERVRALRENVAEYEELLQMQATEARANLDVAAREARALLAQIDPDASDS